MEKKKKQQVKNIHDSLFKWLISAFTHDFFAYYYPKFKIGKIEYLDKEFINKYEFLKDSIVSDLFLLIEIEIDGKFQEVLIVIEHKSERREVRERLYEYSFYARMLRKKPVWSMVLYTDEGIWKKSIPKRLCYGFHSELGKQWFHIDAIKLKEEKSEDLINHHSLVVKLLALKADDRGANREYLVREVLAAAKKMDKQLTEDQKLLIQRFVETYHNLPQNHYQKIKKENKMTFVATTISEYYVHEGELKSEKRVNTAERKLKTAERKVETEKKRGVLIGKIQLAQKVLKLPLTSNSELEAKTLKDLNQVFKQLDSKLE